MESHQIFAQTEPWIAQSRLYIHFLIIGTNPTAGYVLRFDEWLTVGLMKFYTNSRVSPTFPRVRVPEITSN